MTVHYAYSDLGFIVIFNFCNFLGVDSFPLCKVDYLKLSLCLCMFAICVGCVSACVHVTVLFQPFQPIGLGDFHSEEYSPLPQALKVNSLIPCSFFVVGNNYHSLFMA